MKKPIKSLSPNSNKTTLLTLKLSLIVVCGRSEESWGRGDWGEEEDREDKLLGMGAFSLIKFR
jgi:hypothetical protein